MLFDMELETFDYFRSANDFFAADLNEKRRIMNAYVDAYGWPPFVYDALLEKELNEQEYRICNFVHWTSSLFTQYSRLNRFDDDEPLKYKISRFRKYINVIYNKYVDRINDECLVDYFGCRSYLSKIATDISAMVGPGPSLPDMDMTINIWEFTTHPDIAKAMKELGL